MSDAGEAAAAAVIGAARDLATQAVTQATAQLETLIGQAVDAAEDAAQRAVALPADVLRRINELAQQQDPLGAVLWLMLRLANSLAPAGVTLTAYDLAPGTGRPRSLAVTYTSEVATVALAFATADPPGGAIVLSVHGNGNGGGPVKFGAGALSVRVDGLTDDSIAIPFAAGLTVDSRTTVTATVALDAPAAGGPELGFRLGRPALTVTLSPSIEAFHYRVEVALHDNGVTIDLVSMIGDLATVVSLPRIDESLDLALTLEDGRLRLGRLAEAQA
ncbi:MAG TPA: hypothetical protein VFG35_02565 [Actinoplanes sp.]|nr:hypothetical protein [Actinoplanes sp.]